jgi:hypothetical protein
MTAIVVTVVMVVVIAFIASCLFIRPKAFSWATLSLVIMAFAGIGLGFGSYPVAHNIAKASAVGGYHQFLNGSIVKTDVKERTCHKNGSCHKMYDCDCVMVPHYSTDSDGKTTVTYEEECDSCPYVTKEYYYSAEDSLGEEYTFGGVHFATNPVPWSRFHSLAAVSNVPRGAPPRWQHARNALAAGDSDPVTVTGTYENYVLGSEDNILKAASTDIGLLQSKHLLPDHTRNLQDPVYNDWNADKVMFVGFKPNNAAMWQNELMHFNAALGTLKQGDLHIVAIKASAVPVSPEDYLNALKAYWQSDLGKYALPKNGIVLVLGVDDTGSTIQWSRATTGMPTGNGPMLVSLGTELTDTPFTPDAVLGHTKATKVNFVEKEGKTKARVDYQIGLGKAAQTIMVEFPFKRACMACDDPGEAAINGYVDLTSMIPLSTKGAVWTSIIDGLIIVIGWAIVANYIVMFINDEVDRKDEKRQDDDFRNRYGTENSWDSPYSYPHRADTSRRSARYTRSSYTRRKY